jgi:hypothetical protein
MTALLTLPEAIAKIEGFDAQPFNRPTRNRNPGDIEWEQWNAAAPYNATLKRVQPGVKARFACFPTVQQGWNALTHLLLSPEYRDLTIREMVMKYAPPTENASEAYLATVCR